MQHIRRLIYRSGYRPKPGSIFYSRGLDSMYNYIDAWKEREGFK